MNHYLEITRSHVHEIYRELETSGKVIKLFYGVDEDNKNVRNLFAIMKNSSIFAPA